jgi:CHASE2 domain-containing sensor protein
MSLDDVVNHELARLQRIIESGKYSFLQRLSHSKLALIVIASLIVLFQIRNMPSVLATSSLDAAIAVQRPEDSQTVRLVTINDQDYANLFHARSPLDANVLAKILAAVARASPRVIVVDVDTADDSFKTLAAPPVPIVWDVSGDQLADGKFKLDLPIGGSPLPSGSVLALAIAPLDDRGIVRGYQETYPLESGGSVSSPGFAAAQLFKGQPSPPVNAAADTHLIDFHYRFAPVRASDLLQDADSNTWDQLASFKDQAVVIGGTYRVARDRYATPKGLLNGSEIVAQAAASEIAATFIPTVNRWLTGALMLLGGLMTLAIYNWLPFKKAFLSSLLLVPILSIGSNWLLFHRVAAWGAMVPLVFAVIVAELYSKAALYLAFYQRVRDVEKRDKLRAAEAKVAATK